MERRRSSRPALSCLSHSAVRTSLTRWQDQFDAPGAGILCASGGIGSVETAAAAMSFHFPDCFCQVSTATKCPPEAFAFGSLNQTVYKFPGTSLLRCHPKYSQRLGFEEPSKNAQGLPSDSEFVHCNNVTQPRRASRCTMARHTLASMLVSGNTAGCFSGNRAKFLWMLAHVGEQPVFFCLSALATRFWGFLSRE